MVDAPEFSSAGTIRVPEGEELSVIGAYELMPPGSKAIRSGTIEVYFHDPIDTSSLPSNARAALMAKVRVPM